MYPTRLNKALLAAALLGASTAQAQDRRTVAPNFPAKPLRIIVTVTAGGGLDFVTRTVTSRLGERLGVPAVVENIAGANGIIAVNTVIAAPPDGHTLLAAGGSVPINAVFGKFERDVRTSLAPVAQMATQGLLFYVSAGSPVNSIKDLVAEGKRNPGRVSYGSTGVGSVAHLATEVLNLAGGIQMVHVPYKGASAAMADLTAGRLSLLMSAFGVVQPLVKAGKLKMIATATAQRLPEAPDLPTVAEQGFPGYEAANTYTLYTGSGAPAASVLALNREVVAVLADPEVRRAFAKDNSTPAPAHTPEDLKRILVNEMDRWSAVVKAANIKLED